MPYVKNVWVDEVLTEDPRYNILDEADLPISENVKIELETPVVTPGTPLTAEYMNNIEEGIETLDETVEQLATDTDTALAAVNSELDTLTTTVGTLETNVNAHFSLLELGWIAMPGTMSYTSADAPSFVASINLDVTAFLSVGDKIWLTQTTSKYFIVTAIGAFASGATPVTLYGGYANGNYTLANAAISGVYFSKMKSPFGFPLSKDIWDVFAYFSGTCSKTSASTGTWYGGSQMTPAGPSITFPIGMWDVQYEILAEFAVTLGAQGSVGGRVSLSTSETSESDNDFSLSYVYTAPAGAVLQRILAVRSKVLLLNAKATYYGVLFIGSGSTITLTFNSNAWKSSIRARCLYL